MLITYSETNIFRAASGKGSAQALGSLPQEAGLPHLGIGEFVTLYIKQIICYLLFCFYLLFPLPFYLCLVQMVTYQLLHGGSITISGQCRYLSNIILVKVHVSLLLLRLSKLRKFIVQTMSPMTVIHLMNQYLPSKEDFGHMFASLH